VNEVHEGRDVFDFISLQVSDEMPTDIGWQLGLFIAKLLYVVLPEIALSGLVEFQYILNGFGFGDRYQRGAAVVQFFFEGEVGGEVNGHPTKLGSRHLISERLMTIRCTSLVPS